MILTDSEIKRIAKEGDFLDCRYGISREFASTILELQKENARLKKTLERILELCEDQMSQDAEDDEVPQHDEFISIITIIQDSQKPSIAQYVVIALNSVLGVNLQMPRSHE